MVDQKSGTLSTNQTDPTRSGPSKGFTRGRVDRRQVRGSFVSEVYRPPPVPQSPRDPPRGPLTTTVLR